jgi:hypothetical protein
VSDIDGVQRQLSNCATNILSWCASRRLQLNASKTELIWFGSRVNLTKLRLLNQSITVGTENVQPVDTVRDLGVLFDSELSMTKHVAAVVQSCFYQLRRIRQIRRRVGQDVTLQLVIALVISRLDYCNAVLAGLPDSTVGQLQRVQNAAARLVFGLGPKDPISPVYYNCTGYQFRYRITFKLCSIMFSIRSGNCPLYLSDCVTTVAAQSHSQRGLRSASTSNYVLPRLHTKFGERAFSYAGPRAWNSLPDSVRCAPSIAVFKRRLKTYLFKTACRFSLINLCLCVLLDAFL